MLNERIMQLLIHIPSSRTSIIANEEFATSFSARIFSERVLADMCRRSAIVVMVRVSVGKGFLMKSLESGIK